MIDWVNLAANSLWILGCSVILASLSFASWLGSEITGSSRKEKVAKVLRTKGVWRGIHAGGVLFCAGLGATSDSALIAVLWGILGVGVIVHSIIG